MRAVAEEFAAVKRPGSLKTLTYTITIYGPEGTQIRSVERVTIPNIRGERTREAIVRRLEREIWEQIFTAWEDAGIYEKRSKGRRKGPKLGAQGVRNELGGNATFSVEVYAEA